MNRDDFIADLVVQFRDKKDDDRNTVFYKNLTTFADKCLEVNLKDVYDYIVGSHSYSTPFQMAKIYKYATENKMLKQEEREEEFLLYRKCLGFSVVKIEKEKNGKEIKKRLHHPCDTNYSFGSTGCPNCHSTQSTVVQYLATSFEPEAGVILCKEDCHRCSNFLLDSSENLKNNVMGPECSKHGVASNPDKECGSCKCKNCCKDFKEYQDDPRKYLHLQKQSKNDKRTWIGKNLTVGAHVRDDKRLSMPNKKEEKKYERPDFFGLDIRALAESKRV